MQLLDYVIIGFMFGAGFTLAQVIYQVLIEIIKVMYINRAVKKLKNQMLGGEKPDDLYFGKGKETDGNII